MAQCMPAGSADWLDVSCGTDGSSREPFDRAIRPSRALFPSRVARPSARPPARRQTDRHCQWARPQRPLRSLSVPPGSQVSGVCVCTFGFCSRNQLSKWFLKTVFDFAEARGVAAALPRRGRSSCASKFDSFRRRGNPTDVSTIALDEFDLQLLYGTLNALSNSTAQHFWFDLLSHDNA